MKQRLRNTRRTLRNAGIRWRRTRGGDILAFIKVRNRKPPMDTTEQELGQYGSVREMTQDSTIWTQWQGSLELEAPHE